jgi:hypothetical protein
MLARHVPLGCEANAAVVRPLRLSAAGAASYRETGWGGLMLTTLIAASLSHRAYVGARFPIKGTMPARD